MRITRAWCVELNEVVTIDVARRASRILVPGKSPRHASTSARAIRLAGISMGRDVRPRRRPGFVQRDSSADAPPSSDAPFA